MVVSKWGLKHRTTNRAAHKIHPPHQGLHEDEGSEKDLESPIRGFRHKLLSSPSKLMNSFAANNNKPMGRGTITGLLAANKPLWRRLLLATTLSLAGLLVILWLGRYTENMPSKDTRGGKPTAVRSRSLQNNNNKEVLYRDLEDEPNADWEDLKSTLKVGENTLGPAYGSTVKVRRQIIEVGDYAKRPIMEDVKLHVPTSSFIQRENFDSITRWYQEDSHTQIFRMFPGDDNIRNDRIHAPRSEAFSTLGWKRGDGWHEFSGRYTFLKVRNGAVFQLKHNSKFWSIQLCLRQVRDGTYNLIFQTLLDFSGAIVLEEDVEGKSFDIRVLDDGTHHTVYIDGRVRIHGEFTNRTDDETNRARWGFYSPGSAIDRDILILVTGAQVDKVGKDCWSLSCLFSVTWTFWEDVTRLFRGDKGNDNGFD